MDNIDFGKRLRKIRRERKLTCRELSEISGVSFGSISKYELGERTPSISVVVKLAIALDTTINYLVGEEKQETLSVKKLIDNIKNLSDEDYNNLLEDMDVFLKSIQSKYNI